MKLANISIGNALTPKAALLLLPFLLTLALPQAQAQKVTVKRLNPPGSTYAWASAVNNKNRVVGSFSDSAGMHGFIYDGEKYAILTAPKAASVTQAFGINDSGVVSGTYFGKDQLNHRFFLRNGKFTSYDIQKGVSTYVLGINNAANFVGYLGNQGNNRGLVNLGGKLTVFKAKGQPTEAYAINNKNQAVGFFIDPDLAHIHGFVRDAKGEIVQIDVPGSIGWTVCQGINDRGVITGVVRNGLRAKAGKGKLVKVVSLTKHGKLVAYEAQVVTNGTRSEVQVGPDGKPLEPEE